MSVQLSSFGIVPGHPSPEAFRTLGVPGDKELGSKRRRDPHTEQQAVELNARHY